MVGFKLKMSLGDLLLLVGLVGFFCFFVFVAYLYFTETIPRQDKCKELENKYIYVNNLTKKELDFLIVRC